MKATQPTQNLKSCFCAIVCMRIKEMSVPYLKVEACIPVYNDEYMQDERADTEQVRVVSLCLCTVKVLIHPVK